MSTIRILPTYAPTSITRGAFYLKFTLDEEEAVERVIASEPRLRAARRRLDLLSELFVGDQTMFDYLNELARLRIITPKRVNELIGAAPQDHLADERPPPDGWGEVITDMSLTA
jgi:hypothetical protein